MNMSSIRRLLLLLVAMLATASQASAQELQAKVTINRNQIQGTDASVFESLQQTLEQFINDRAVQLRSVATHTMLHSTSRRNILLQAFLSPT